MPLSQSDFESLVKSLRTLNTESTSIDVKVDLHLATDGDKAEFIHHVAALANNAIPSYLIVGIENKSWKIKGISSNSPLLDSDQTQNRMNQILENKLDPQLSIRYRTYKFEESTVGLVEIEGIRAPYIIAISDNNYGGRRTKGSKFNLQRGVFYVRHGESTITANRQSRILEILDQQKKIEPNTTGIFLNKHNYFDTDSDHFGENDLTKGLVEVYRGVTSGKAFDTKVASSWVSMVFVPVSNNCTIDTAILPSKLQPDNRIGREGEWFHGLPRPIVELLWNSKGSPSRVHGRWFPTNHENPSEYTHAVEIYPTGTIHLVVSYPLFYEREFEGFSSVVRFYSFVNLIGYLWQMCYLARAIYKDVDYRNKTLILLGLHGTKGTYLLDLATGANKKWVTVGDWRYEPNPKDQAQEKHILIERKINLVDSNDVEIEQLIRMVAGELGQYYNQQTPRCFTPDEDIFPVKWYCSTNSR